MIKNKKDLQKIKEKYLPTLKIRKEEICPANRWEIMVCGGTGCSSTGSYLILEKFKKEIERYNLTTEANINQTGCFGFCRMGPIVLIHPGNVFYCQVDSKDIQEIVQQHLLRGRIVKRLLYKDPENQKSIKNMSEIKFFHHQQRIALRHCGLINPEDLNEYIAADGYFALDKILEENNPSKIIKTVIDSGLRGRGGGGFLTGIKWEKVFKEEAYPKYVVCNADEGDPGAFMDRSILEGDPFSILEAMTIAGFAVGAKEGYIYIRAEYSIATNRLKNAIILANSQGLLGKNILGSSFSFQIDIRLGAGAFVCGEETALLNSAMGKRGEPIPRPPYPAKDGLFGKPTLLNNVETYANIPPIILNGANYFNTIGTKNSKGTKVFSLAGKINNTGLIEVPMGTTLREVIFNIGGGIPNGKKFKAVQTGGPSGGVIPSQYLDTPIDYESLQQVGSIMGSGGLIVLDEDNCMVDIAKFYLQFTQEESCGKCTPCRIGTKKLLEMMEKITNGEGNLEDLKEIEKLSQEIKEYSLCGLGQTAPNPVISTLRYFHSEYEAHILEKDCPAKVCKKLLKYNISQGKCISCGLCAKSCPVEAINSQEKIYSIDSKKCIRCGLCLNQCPKKAIYKS